MPGLCTKKFMHWRPALLPSIVRFQKCPPFFDKKLRNLCLTEKRAFIKYLLNFVTSQYIILTENPEIMCMSHMLG